MPLQHLPDLAELVLGERWIPNVVDELEAERLPHRGLLMRPRLEREEAVVGARAGGTDAAEGQRVDYKAHVRGVAVLACVCVNV